MRLYAAGSLRAVMTELAQSYARRRTAVAGTFGPSGLLRERIEKGEPADVFASADMANPRRSRRAGRRGRRSCSRATGYARWWRPVHGDAPTRCSIGCSIRGSKLGTSTPKADPSGDYAWQLFEKADACAPAPTRRLTPRR